MIEEIKLITEAMQSLSGTALYAFMAYLILGKLIPIVIGWGCGLTLACILSKRIVSLIQVCVPAVDVAKQIRDGLDIGSGGYIYDSEMAKIRKILPKMIATYKEALNKK